MVTGPPGLQQLGQWGPNYQDSMVTTIGLLKPAKCFRNVVPSDEYKFKSDKFQSDTKFYRDLIPAF